MKAITAAAALAAVLLPVAASAGTLEVNSGSGQRGLTIAANQPLGQTFTALDGALTSFGFRINVLNPGTAGGALTLRLLDGSGTGGTLLGSGSFTPTGIPTDRSYAWVDFAFAGLKLAAGQRYTALLTSDTNRYALGYGPDINIFTGVPLGGDAYGGGSLIGYQSFDRVCATGICDANFRLTTAAAAVPEPVTWSLMILGVGVAGGVLRRRRSALLAA